MFVTSAFAETSVSGTAPAAAATQAGTAAEGGHGTFPPFNPVYFPSQILWLAITFIVFYIFVKQTLLPRIGGILESRRERIASDLDNAAKMKTDADAAVAAYEQELADARARAGEIGQKARDAAKAEAEAERKKVETALDGKLAESERRIAGIKAAAMKDVGAVAEETASLIVERLTGGAPARAEIAAAVKAVQE